MGAGRTSFLTDANLLLLRQFHHLHTENRTKLMLGFFKHVFELSTRARRHDCIQDVHQFKYSSPFFAGPFFPFLPAFQSHAKSQSLENTEERNEPLAAISLRRTGWREYSLASARRTSFFTIWSYSPPLPRIVAAANSEVSSASAEVSGSSSWSVEGEGEGRRRVGGGEGEGSACCLNIGQ